MTKKKYISTGANPLSIDIVDNGTLFTFDFRGGLRHPIFIPPSYITEDPKEQKMLEGHPLFNKAFKVEVEIQPEKKEDVVSEPVSEFDNESKDELQSVTLANVQDAKTWLNREHGVPFTKTKNRAKVIEEAEKLGFDIQFESDKI